MTQKLILRHGDCVDVLKGYEDGSLGAIVSDPPYHIAFMGKKWDAEGAGIAFSADLWDEVYRALRPGGVIKAFSGTRTYHRMAQAMERAGFVGLRVESWNYGSGFPKSHNVAVYLDKLLEGGKCRSITRKGVGNLNGKFGEAYKDFVSQSKNHQTQHPEAQAWNGWGTALKPSWEPVIVGRKPE